MSRVPVEQVTPHRHERLGAWFASYGFVARATALVVGGVLLVGAAYVLFPLTEDATFQRELVVAALGAVVTIAAAVAVAGVSLWKEFRARREAALLQRFDARTWARTALRVGRMEVPDVVVVASCSQHGQWTDRVGFVFTDFGARRPGAAELPALLERRLPALQSAAEAQGVTLTDDPCVDLIGATVRLQIDQAGRRRPFYELRPAEGRYHEFAVTTADLDGPWQPGGAGPATTLRALWNAQPTGIGDVSALPAMAKIGVGTAVVTADNRLVLGVRGKTFVAGSQHAKDGRSSVHIVAEGMVPGDLSRSGRLDPAETSRRALVEELNLGSRQESLGRVDSLAATGFFFDQARWQPCFAFLARTDATWDELQTLAPAASDYWEVERLISLPFDIRHAGVRHLLTGTHPDLSLASNHAAAVLWFALLHEHGLFEMRNALTQLAAVYRLM